MAFGAAGDGITDDSAALAAALAAERRVFIASDVTLLVGDVTIPSDRTLFGGGIIKKINSAPAGLHITGDNVVIRGLTFAGQEVWGQPNCDIKLGDGAANIRVVNNTFQTRTYSAVCGADDTGAGGGEYTEHVSAVLVANNLFTGYARPLFLHSIDNITISNNIIRDSYFDAIRLRENDRDALIHGNQFINIGDPSWPDLQTRDAVDAYWGGQNLTIANNIIRKTASIGFDLKGVSEDGTIGASNIIVAHNQIYETRGSGMVIHGSDDYDGGGSFASNYGILITGNIVEYCNQQNIGGAGSSGDAAIYVKGLLRYANITDNLVAFNYGRGISVRNLGVGQQVVGSFRVSGNMVLNNGDGVTFVHGIVLSTIDGLIVKDNIAENDLGLPNPVQSIGLAIVSTGSAGYVIDKTMIIADNIVRNNTDYQIVIDPNLERVNGVAVFRDNIEVGPNANYRATWQQQRSTFFGAAPPAINEGTFRQGDIIWNSSPTEQGSAGSRYVIQGWQCVAAGNPGTWVQMRAPTGN